jgi:hypothetical protein
VLLAAAAERGLSGACLLGELPFFAAGVPNPGASKAVLEVFVAMAGVSLDFTEIADQAASVKRGLLELLGKMKQAAQQQGEPGEEGDFDVQPDAAEPADADDAGAPMDEAPRELDAATRQRIESLFEEASRDRERAFQLKEELDRLGVFERYEDRFLDLFKKGE